MHDLPVTRLNSSAATVVHSCLSLAASFVAQPDRPARQGEELSNQRSVQNGRWPHAQRHAKPEKWENVPAAAVTAKRMPCPRCRGGQMRKGEDLSWEGELSEGHREESLGPPSVLEFLERR